MYMAGMENLRRIVDQICRDKGIDRDLLIDAIEEAVRSAVKKKYGGQRDIEVQYNDELGEVEVFQYRTVVEKVVNEAREISLEEARRRDPEAGLDDDIGERLTDISELGRIAAQSAKQVIIHRMREAEREVVYEMYRDREGTVVNGIVQRFERGDMIVNLGRTDALLPRDGQILKQRTYKQGDRIRAYLQQVRRSRSELAEEEAQGRSRYRDAQLILSRTCNEFLVKLFELEVPEIAEGTVRIMGVSRDPGFRAKIAVSSLESDVDPVGACVGLKGSRVQNVVQELQGERIDIVPWSPDPVKYVCNALAPAQVNMVEVDDEHKTLLVVVPDNQLSLAIDPIRSSPFKAAALRLFSATACKPGYKVANDAITTPVSPKEGSTRSIYHINEFEGPTTSTPALARRSRFVYSRYAARCRATAVLPVPGPPCTTRTPARSERIIASCSA